MRFTQRLMAGTAVVALATAGAVVAVAGPASATTPTGGCWVYGFDEGDPLESTEPSYDISSGPAAWTDSAASPPGAADYTLTSSGGTMVGSTRNFSLTFNKGPKSAAPAVGTAYYYFSVNGTNLPAVGIPMNIGAGQVQAGGTVNGSYTIAAGGTNTITLRKVVYDATASGVRVGCNGQTGSALSGPTAPYGVNPATTPVDTNITETFTAFAVANASITGISNQSVTTHARAGDVLSFAASAFSGAGTGTAELCDAAGDNCHATSSTFTVAGDGTGTGTITVPASFTGAKSLKLSSNGEVGLKAFTVLGTPTVSVNLVGGPVGTTVQVTGTNWDPNTVVSVGGYKAGPPFPPPASTIDTAVSFTANASGAITGNYTVNDPLTRYIGGTENHNGTPIFASTAFTASGDSCVAKAGAAATGSCSTLNTVKLTVTAGNLTMAKVSGDIQLSAVTLNGTAQSSTGNLRQVTVKDYRGGSLGWALTGKFSGLTGPATISSDKLTWTPTCTKDATNNDDTVTTGAVGAFATSTTAMPLCEVLVANVGADGASGGDTTVDAALSLALGANQKAGNYVGTLTLSLS